MAAPLLVGLGGGSCAGKTTLAELTGKRLLPTPAAVIAADRYYRPLDHLPREERHRENFDSPEMLDRELLKSHLLRLKAGETIEIPVYDFRLHTRSEETEPLDPPPVVLVEGIFLLADPELRGLVDLAIYVETGEGKRRARRIRRDREERGRTEEEVRRRYRSQVLPAHRRLSGPARKGADLVVSGEENPEESARIIAGRIDGMLSRRQNKRGPG